MHQGDLRSLSDCQVVKGVYYLNVVDEVTQWESVLAVPALERRFVQPALKAVLLQTFPFVILGIHSDNGSEFVNYATEELLREFEVQFTRLAGAAQQRQRPGREQECVRGAQAVRLRAHPGRLLLRHQWLHRWRAGRAHQLPSPVLVPAS